MHLPRRLRERLLSIPRTHPAAHDAGSTIAAATSHACGTVTFTNG
jgi:hypothetical protein